MIHVGVVTVALDRVKVNEYDPSESDPVVTDQVPLALTFSLNKTV
jgi:hypothetical protein